MRGRLGFALVVALALGAISSDLLSDQATRYWLFVSSLFLKLLMALGMPAELAFGTSLLLGVAGVFLSFFAFGLCLTIGRRHEPGVTA